MRLALFGGFWRGARGAHSDDDEREDALADDVPVEVPNAELGAREVGGGLGPLPRESGEVCQEREELVICFF